MGRVFAVSDLHGQRALWDQIKAYLAPDDTLYFLGDATGRGPAGFEIMKELFSDPRVVYIVGNHEIMFADAIKEIRKYGGEWVGSSLDIAISNGEYPTLDAWTEAGMNYDWIKIIQYKTFLHKEYINTEGIKIVLCHAGFSPGLEPKENNIFDWVWDRQHIYDKIKTQDNIIVVHGHTPVPLLEKDLNEFYDAIKQSSHPERTKLYTYENKNGACFYGQGYKICIDTGAFATGHSVLLNLDTLEVIPFNAKIE